MRDDKYISITVARGEIGIMHLINRENFWELMNSIKKNYVNNNEISSQLVELIPNTMGVEIYEDRNKEVDVPFIVVETFDGEKIIVKIPRKHKIIWGILEEFVK